MKNRFSKSVGLILALCIGVSAFLCGCNGNEPHFPVAVSDTTRSALELNYTGYSDDELGEIYSFMCEGNNVNQLNSKYEILCLRKDDDGYRVIYKGKKSIISLRFDSQGNWIETEKSGCIYRLTNTRGEFDKLAVGDTVAMVQKADPKGYYPFLTDSSSEKLVTYHYTGDGYCTTIQYDEDYTITAISYELM